LRMGARDYRERLKGICVKVKYHDFKSTTHEELVRAFPKEEDFRRLLIAVWNKRAEPIRLLGVGAKLASSKAKEAPLQQLALL